MIRGWCQCLRFFDAKTINRLLSQLGFRNAPHVLEISLLIRNGLCLQVEPLQSWTPAYGRPIDMAELRYVVYFVYTL